MQYLFDTLTVDPGDHTAYAYWHGTADPVTGQFNVVKAKKILSGEEKLLAMLPKFCAVLKSFQPKCCIIEDVRVYTGSAVSMASAARGDLIGLARLIGAYCEACRVRGVDFQLMQPMHWKGQMPDSVVKKHVEMILKKEYRSEHVISALGIGLARARLFPAGNAS